MKRITVIIIILVILTSIVGCFFLVFPIKYSKFIKKYANAYNISTSMVASVINIESGYNAHAKSKAGAIGLMQLLPSTAEEIATKLQIEYNDEILLNEEINIMFGCYYLAYLMKYFDNNITNSLASYNWGLSNVNNWISNGNIDESGNIINIPVNETKNYLRKFRINNFFYNILY